MSQARIAIIGAGPAGLMAAEVIAEAGFNVDVFDAMPSVARKFLLAGIGGMNITHSEPYAQFVQRYGDASAWLRPMLDAFTPDDLRHWIHALGIETFVGTSGRVFPRDMKAAPLLRAWLHRLRQQGVNFHPRHRWVALTPTDQGLIWTLAQPEGMVEKQCDAVVLALGGASWPKLGSDGHWINLLRPLGVEINELKASNCGFELPWSAWLQQQFAGTPLKNIGVRLTDHQGRCHYKVGEFIVSQYGIEGSLIYALSAPLRDTLLLKPEHAFIELDWLPQLSHEQIVAKLSNPRKGMSLSNVLRKKLSLPAITNALLKECCPTLDRQDNHALARTLKAMALPAVTATRPISEAISSAGGISQEACTDALMLKALPNVFVAGEMLDWEAPTGGYLLSACFASGRWAGQQLVAQLHREADRLTD